MAKEKTEGLDDVLKKIRKEYGDSIISYGKDDVGNFGVIPFGITSLDMITGIGGIPKGRVTEVHGMDGTFKTTFTLELIKSSQKKGGKCAFIDAEYAYQPEYAETIGVDNNTLILVHPSSAEECFNVIESLVDSGEIDLIVLDSIAALSPNAELQNEFGSSNMGVMARLMGQFFRKITAKVGKTGTALVMINQLREMLGGYVPMKTTPGGNALRFYASMRFEVSKSAIKEGTDIKGVNLKIKCVKNKLAKPFLSTELECYYGKGVDKLKDLIDTACILGVIQRAGAGWMNIEGEKIQGLDKAKEFLEANPHLIPQIEEQVKKTIDDSKQREV